MLPVSLVQPLVARQIVGRGGSFGRDAPELPLLERHVDRPDEREGIRKTLQVRAKIYHGGGRRRAAPLHLEMSFDKAYRVSNQPSPPIAIDSRFDVRDCL